MKTKPIRITHFFSELEGVISHAWTSGNDSNIAENVGNGFYASRKALGELKELQANPQGLKVGIVTTRRFSTAQAALKVIPHNYAVLDYGTIVLIDDQPDREWLETLRPYIGNPLTWEKKGVLWDYAQQVRAELGLQGFEVYSDDRFGSFRVVPPPPFTKAELEQLFQIKRPEGISAVLIDNSVDFFPTLAGNANAVHHVLKRLGTTDLSSVAYAGVEPMNLALFGQFYPITVKDADAKVKVAVKDRGGYISHYMRHEATDDIVSHVKQLAKGR